MKKNFLGKVLVIAALSFLAVSCIKDNNNTAKNAKVAVLLPNDAVVDRWATDMANLKSVMGMYGFNTTYYTAPETPEGADQQVEQLREAIRSGAKYIVLTAIDYKKINASGLLEKNPDVKVVCHDRLGLDNPRIAYISSTDTREVGRMQAMFLLNHFHSSGAMNMTLEILQGPDTDVNAREYYEGAMELLRKYIDNGIIYVKSGKTSYEQVKSASWDIAAGRMAMQERLNSYQGLQLPDMILAANDNLAQGAIEAMALAGHPLFIPVITGQDNTVMGQENIKNMLQAMTIDKNLMDMAYNTALIINSLVSGSPVQTSECISAGSVKIPAIYSKLTLKTVDSY